jgi:CRISPR-associated protein Cas1
MKLPKPPAVPQRERTSVVFVERGQIDVIDGVMVVTDISGVRMQLPIGGIACLMLEPGTRVSHAAVTLAARVGCLLVWVGEGAVRVYSAGQPLSHRSDRLLQQVRAALDPAARLRVVRHMYETRFGEPVPTERDVDQLRGMEGARVRRLYGVLAERHGVVWNGRNYDPQAWGSGDIANRCLSAANSCLYGVCEAAILAAGYSPAVGFIHTGKPHSFTYDIADIHKFDTVVPAAFRIAAQRPQEPEREVRRACRDAFRASNILETLIPSIQDVLSAARLPELDVRGVVPPYLREDDPFADDPDHD